MPYDPSSVNPPETGWYFCKHPHKPGWLLRWIHLNQAYTCPLDSLTPDAEARMIERGHIAQYAEIRPVEFPAPETKGQTAHV